MMVKFTEKCTMGCPHCLNDAKADGKDMDKNILLDTLKFLRDNNLGQIHFIITGGEPTEHNDFDTFIKEVIDFGKEYSCFNVITITTNGELIQNDPERFKGYIEYGRQNGICITFQVSADVRYYPRRIATHKRIFKENGFVMCDDCIEQIYPQGRALDNDIPWQSKCSKCFNVRALSHQLSKNAKLRDIEMELALRGKFCTPHIGIDGSIKLGESDLCPACASIYDDMDTIMEKIRNFKCNKCDHINNSLPDIYKALL